MKNYQRNILQVLVIIGLCVFNLKANEIANSGTVKFASEIKSTAYNVGGGGTLCKDTGVSITLDGSDFGGDYYLKKDGTTDTSTRKKGTGLALSWDGITATGTYTVVKGLSPEAAQTGSVVVSSGEALAAPVIDDKIYYSNQQILTNQPMTVSSVSGVTFKWYDEDDNWLADGVTYTINNFSTIGTTVLKVKATKNGCESDITTVSAIISDAILPTSITKDTEHNQDYLQATGTPATDIKWYWQGTNSVGTDFSIDAKVYDYRVTLDTSYYLRAFDHDKRLWSPTSLEYSYVKSTDDVTPGSTADYLAKGVETSPFAYASGTVYNKVKAYDVKQSGMTDTNIKSASADPNNVSLSTQFADGLGRPIQVISRKASPDEKDIAQAMHYDGFGRQTTQYLPWESTSTNGDFKTNPFNDQGLFYQGHQADEDVWYNKTVFENSPLNRTRMTMAAGDAWGGTAVGVKADYAFNTADDDIRIWHLDANGDPESKDQDVYPPGTLALSITTDEEGAHTKQWTNKLGQVVLKQVQMMDSITGAYESYLNTYYVYDDYGNLRYVAPPKAVDLLTPSWTWGSSMDELVFQYTYDDRGRMVSKKVPGAGVVKMIYDKLDRLVLTQDSVQSSKSKPEWTFTKYDDLGRPVMTGILKSNTTRTDLQDSLDIWSNDWSVKTLAPNASGVIEGQTITLSAHVPGTTKYEAVDEIIFLPGFETDEAFETELGITLSGNYTAFMGYHDATFPLMKDQDMEVLTVNYYDDYDFTSRTFNTVTPGWHSAGGSLNAVTPSQYAHVMGLATGSSVKVLGTEDQWLHTVMFYDDRGRVIQTQGDNHLGGEDISSMQYDFSGKVLMSYTEHDNPLASSNGSTTILKQFTYDDNGRLLNIEQKLNDTGSFKRLVTNTYNDLGELDTKKLGDATTPLETLEYDYNIRGWLTGINGDYATGTGADNAHFFGMTLNYDDGFSKGYRNGNIAGTQWRTPSSSKRKSYGYQYDPVNRLTQGNYRQYENSDWRNTTSDYSTVYTYDNNGNIATLKRWGEVAGTTTLIDDLTYGYAANTNQLDYVKDAKGDMGQGDFRGDNTTTVDFDYDLNGNMNEDQTKGIDAGDITYNHLNLPEVITFDNSSSKTITYTYDAAGIKLQKKVNDGGAITTTDYVGGFIYQGNQLQQFGHEEGRVRLSGSSLVYDYYIKDHLGNTRMTLTEETGSTLYFASMETEYEDFEESLFLNMDDTRVVSTAGNYTIDAGITANEAARLNGNDATRRTGPGKLMAVSPGDDIDMEVFAYYTGTIGTNSAHSNATVVTAVASAFGGLNGGNNEQQAIYDLFNSNAASVVVGTSGSSSQPRAYLNYILFDQDFNYLDAGFDQVTSSAQDNHEKLTLAKTINEGGFIYIYVSNESDANFDVYFDDLRITHNKGSILQEDHYYPFGMNISALSSTAPLAKPNRYKYNGNEEQLDFDWNIYDFNARLYDAQLGRFGAVDPLVEKQANWNPYHFSFNNPSSLNDPTGLDATARAQRKQRRIARRSAVSVYSSYSLESDGNGCEPGDPCWEQKVQENILAIELLNLKHAFYNQIFIELGIKKRAVLAMTTNGGFTTEFVDSPEKSYWEGVKAKFLNLLTIGGYVTGGSNPALLFAKSPAGSASDDLGQAAIDIATSMANKNSVIFDCFECAGGIVDALKAKGIKGEILDLTTVSGSKRGNIWSDTANQTIATSGRHRAVLVNGKVFDNIHTNGISLENWLADFHSVFGFELKRTEF